MMAPRAVPANNNGAANNAPVGRNTTSSETSPEANDNSVSGSHLNEERKSIQKYLTNCKSYYSCIYCRTHLANHDELVSRSFQGNHGRAYLFNSVINVYCGPAVQRQLTTGSHAVADIFCNHCKTTLGWKYEKAFVETQKYKEGKYIIELAHVVRENHHLEFDKRQMLLLSQQQATTRSNMSTSSMGSPSSSLSSPSSPRQPKTTTTTTAATTSKRWSSSLSPNETFNVAVDDDDDDLMFPFYDDLCMDGCSILPAGSLSSSMHNRARRSLYLDSTPYDWKYSTSLSPPTGPTTDQSASASASSSSSSSSSASSSSSPCSSTSTTAGIKQPAKLQLTTATNAARAGNDDTSPISPTPSTSGSPPGLTSGPVQSAQSKEQRLNCKDKINDSNSNIINNNNNNNNSDNNSNNNVTKLIGNELAQQQRNREVDESEIQFDFEVDAQQHHSQPYQMATENRQPQPQPPPQQQQPNCDPSNIDKTSANAKSMSLSAASQQPVQNNAGPSAQTLRADIGVGGGVGVGGDHNNDGNGNNGASGINGAPKLPANGSGSRSISLDDEEFYDCYAG